MQKVATVHPAHADMSEQYLRRQVSNVERGSGNNYNIECAHPIIPSNPQTRPGQAKARALDQSPTVKNQSWQRLCIGALWMLFCRRSGAFKDVRACRTCNRLGISFESWRDKGLREEVLNSDRPRRVRGSKVLQDKATTRCFFCRCGIR